jgi:hypothetical protein
MSRQKKLFTQSNQTLVEVELSFNEERIRCEGQFICLTDLWKSIGGSVASRPKDWLGNDDVAEFMLTVIANSSHVLKGDARTHLEQRPDKQRKSQSLIEWCTQAKQLAIESDFIRVTRGRNGATFAHWQIGLAYAKYLSPELHMHVNEVYMRYQMGDISLAEEVVTRTTPEQQELHLARMQGIVTRNFLTRTLQEHGVKGYGFAQCTNGTYKGLFDSDAKQLREQKGLPAKTNVREHMNIDELVSVSFAEILAKNDISANEFQGNQSCANSCYQNGIEVKNLLNKRRNDR